MEIFIENKITSKLNVFKTKIKRNVNKKGNLNLTYEIIKMSTAFIDFQLKNNTKNDMIIYRRSKFCLP